MKNFEENQITDLSDLSQITGGGNSGPELTVHLKGILDGIKGNTTVEVDLKLSKG